MARSSLAAIVIAVAVVAVGCSRSGSSTVQHAPATVTTVAASPAGAGTFGTLKDVCGPGTATGATAQGVTDTEIDVSTMADPGATASPGLDQELFDTATAFEHWCDAAGGIRGRKLEVHERDSALFYVAQQMQAVCQSDFALVGNGEAFDSSGVAPRVACGLPELPGYVDSPQASEAPLDVQANPLPIQEETPSMFLGVKHIDPNDSKVGFLVGNIAGVTTTGERFRDAAKAAGFTVAYYSLYPATGIDNPQSYVEQMKAAGVQVLMQLGDNPTLVAIEKAMQTLGWYPDAIVETTQAYDPTVIANGGSAIKNTWIEDYFWPFPPASQNPATAQYITIMKTDDPGGKIAQLGLNAWDAWLLFAEAADACGSNLTRACLLQQAASETAWTAGGLKPPVNTSTTNRQMATCYLYMKATAAGFAVDTSFLPPTPGQAPFNCNPGNAIRLTTDYVPTEPKPKT